MHQGHRIGAILLMSGEGLRFGSPIPKQFHQLGNKKIYRHALDICIKTEIFDEIILVCLDKWKELIQNETGGLARTAAGGKSRQESSYAGLKAFNLQPKVVLIHDAVRPFVSENIIKKNVEQALIHGAVNTCIPSADTLVFSTDRQEIKAIPNRADYMRGQTPQTFLYDWILEAHEAARIQKIANATDDCRLILAAGKPVHIVPGSEKNLKITSEFDLKMAEAFLSLDLL